MSAIRVLNNSIVILLFGAFLALSSCEISSFDRAADYVSWVENKDNNLRQEKRIGDLIYILQYKPHMYIALQELNTPNPQESEIKTKLDELGVLAYFNLRIKHANNADVVKHLISSPEEFMQRSNYLSFEFQQDITMVQSGDSIPCLLFQEVKNYGIAPYVDFVLGFNQISEVNDLQVVINDHGFNTGLVKFTIPSTTLKNIPELRL